MNTFIVLFRGINVSGQKKIKMADLKNQLQDIGLHKIKTYIQSGNVIVHTPLDADALNQEIRQKIEQEYGFSVELIIKTPADLQNIIRKNPLCNRDLQRMYVTFLQEIPANDKVLALRQVDYSPEEYTLHNDIIYFFSPHGYGKAKMNNNFFENKLKTTATTRNWKTVNKLLDMSDQ